MLTEYTDIFAQGFKTVDEVEQEFAKAFGESYAYLDPTAAELMRQVEASSFSRPDLESRRDICSGTAFASAMSLDMVTTAPECGSTLATLWLTCANRVCASSMRVPCAQIIASCFFATVEKVACPKNVEEDESFVYELATVSFKLPKVRFSYECASLLCHRTHRQYAHRFVARCTRIHHGHVFGSVSTQCLSASATAF